MNFTETFIRKPIMTTLVMVVVLIFGIAAYTKLPISDLPVVDSPVITINVAYPGASPDTMASTVASPLENECTQIPGLVNIISANTEGQTSITLTFNLTRNVDLAAPDVQAAISRASANLPTDLPSQPTYTKTNPSDAPIMYLCATSDTLTAGALYDFANKRVGQRLSMIEGVSQIQVWGAKAAIRVQADPRKLASYGIGINEIADAVKNGTVTIPGGSINGPIRAFSIEPKGQLLNAKEYDNLIVAYRNNSPVRLKDVATCVDSTDNDVVNVTYGRSGEDMRPGAVVIAVSRATGTNTVALSKNIKETVKELTREMPRSIKVETLYDKSESITESITDVKNTIVIALILVVLVIFLFLGRLSDTIIPAVTLPMSLFATFIIMYAAHFSLDNLSLMAIILAIGFVVDDAIVVLENTVRLIEEGAKPLQAAIQSAKEITFTIISMTLSLSVIFIPLIFMGGIVGRTFSEFAITVVATIICSGIISLVLSPMMCARMLKQKQSGNTKLQKAVGNYLGSVIKKYGVLLKWTLQHKIITLIAWVVCMTGTVVLFLVLPQTFLPEGDSGAINGQMMAPLGISTEKMRGFQDKVNKTMLDDPDIERALSVTGLQPGADQSTGPVFAVLKPNGKRRPMPQAVHWLRAQQAKIPDGFVFIQAIPALKISTGGESTAAGSKYSYTITGSDQDQLYEVALKLGENMKALPGFMDVQNSVKLNMPQLELAISRDRASTLGIGAGAIESALALSYAQGKTTLYKTDVDQYQVIVELDKKYQEWPEDLGQIYIHSKMTNGLVPLSAIARWKERVGPQNVPHYNQLPSATISFNLQAGMALGTATKALEEAARVILPPGVSGTLQGEAEEFQGAIASLGILIIIAIFIKYVILGILYESYTHPMTILTTLPVATFGGLATLFLFRSELSLYSYVGIFMLLGIVAKNGIMMVDFAVQNLEKGNTTNFDAIYEASIVRFRPILMTGLAAIMGAMPIALGFGADGSSRRPLGLIVVGGLIFSQVVTLFITPGIFLYLQDFQEKYLDKFELFRSGAARKRSE